MGRSRWLASVLGGCVLLAAATASAQGTVVLRAGFMPDPRIVAGMAGGPISASTMSGGCVGWIPIRAQHRVVLTTPMGFFRIFAESSIDTTLFVRTPTGQVMCADDTYGNNPGVDLNGAMPGVYEVFVGSYSQGQNAPYTVGLTELRNVAPGGGAAIAVPPSPPPMAIPVPPPAYGGGGGVLASGFMPDPRTFNGISGGPISASAMNPACRGYIGAVPSHTIVLTTFFGFIRFWASSSGDTTLFIRTPTGQVFCADDTYGFNPGVDLRGAMPGQYQVFVGSYSMGQNYPYTLGVTELPSSTPGGPAVAVPPSPPMMPPMGGGSMALQSGFMPDPRMASGFSGGPMQASNINPSCRGTVPLAPQHTIYLTTPFAFLRIYAQSSGDTTLMIRTPMGQVFCADDTYGFNPGVDLQGAMPGAYQVFVGTYGGSGSYPYTLGVTELPHVHP